jgi:O-antigen ligase
MTIGQGATAAGPKDSIACSIRATEQRERTPWLLAFLCFVIPALPSYVVLAGPLKSNGSPAVAIAVMFFGLAVLGFIVMRRTATTRTLRPGIAFILVFFLLELAVYGVGLTHWDGPVIQASKTRGLITVIAFTGLTLYVMTRIQTTRQRTVVLGCLAIGLTFACTVGLLQRTGIDLRFLFQPPGFVVGVDYLQFYQRFGAVRVWGTSIHPLEFSVLAAVTVPLTIHFARYAANRQVRWLAMLGCGVALLALPASVSRSGVVALTAALLVYIWSFKVRDLAVGLVAAVALVVGYISVFPASAHAYWLTILSEGDVSVQGRIDDYAAVGDAFRANPVFGLGLGNVLSTAGGKTDGVLDNEWLDQIVQGGIVGVTAMVALAAGGIFGVSAALRTASTPRERDQAYMIGSIFVATLSSSFTMDLFTVCHQVMFILLISFGLLWSNLKVSLPEPRTASPRVHYRVG